MTETSEAELDPRTAAEAFDNLVTLQGAKSSLVQQVWIYHRETKESHHVLSQADLIPEEIPRIDVPGKWNVQLGKSSPWTAYGESFERSPIEAFNWYDELVKTGRWVLPRQEITAPRALLDLLDEPRWPTLVTRDNVIAVPFVSRREASTRMHHLLSNKPVLDGVLNSLELAKLHEALKLHLQVDLEGVPELLQSAHFFQPLPFVRFVSTRLDRPKDGDDRGVLVNIVPRRGAPLEKLELHVVEHRATGWRLLAKMRPTAPFYRVALNEDVAQIAIRLYHDDLGLLLKEGPHAFLRGVNIRMQLQSRERRIQLPARSGHPAKLLRIPVSSGEPIHVVEGDNTRSAATVLHTIAARLKAGSVPKELEEWFDDIVEAKTAVRKILTQAEERAWVVDPYFASTEVTEWLSSVSQARAEIRVMTSSSGLRQRLIQGHDDLTKRDLEVEHLKRLEEAIATAHQNRDINQTTARVMKGKNSPIHDRFLVADKKVWLLGSSLNTFGARGTMLVELRRPVRVLRELEKAWTNAHSLRDRIQHLTSENAGEEA